MPAGDALLILARLFTFDAVMALATGRQERISRLRTCGGRSRPRSGVLMLALAMVGKHLDDAAIANAAMVALLQHPLEFSA